jgi:superfamily II DNA/RNA helicase
MASENVNVKGTEMANCICINCTVDRSLDALTWFNLLKIKKKFEVSGLSWIMKYYSFQAADLDDVFKENVRKSQYEKPTPIQKWAIPAVLRGRDIMGCAQTGSGKTVSWVRFCLENVSLP